MLWYVRPTAPGLRAETREAETALPVVQSGNLAFKVEGGTVTLLGQVKQPVLKDDTTRAVKGIEGVESVVNQIEVLPLSPNDDRIRRAVYRLARRPGDPHHRQERQPDAGGRGRHRGR